MISRWVRQIILAGLLHVILIWQAVEAYQGDYVAKWSTGSKHHHHPSIHQHRMAQHALPLPHHPHRHHHDYKSNRESHVKSQNTHFYHERDHRTGRLVTTTTSKAIPRATVTWKWRPTTAIPPVARFSHQSSIEDNADSAAFKDRPGEGELVELQPWSTRNKQIFIGQFRMKINDTIPPNLHDGSAWSHYKNPEQHDERHSQFEGKHHTMMLGKTSRIADVHPIKISHDDSMVKTIPDNKEDYDYYYSEDDESEEVAAVANKIEESKGRQDVTDDFDDYLDDEPNPQSDDQNLNSLKTESLTEEKWKNYGTAEAVEKSRRRYNNEAQSAAGEHIRRIKKEAKCHWPHPKVIPVTEASKRFMPHCTILHRCGDDTGCCDYDTKTCAAKTTTTVHLHFYVLPLVGPATVEVRSFVNHTECHCVDRCYLSSCIDGTDVGMRNASGAAASDTLNESETCQCPTHFDAVQEEFGRGRCRCDCLNSGQACHILKRGQDGFPAEDQKCISDKKCQVPTCQYGQYSTYSGRCPKVKHQKRTISRYDFT